jgi:predicted Zn-dependent protease
VLICTFMKKLRWSKISLIAIVLAIGLSQTSCKDEVPEVPAIRFVDDFYAGTNSLELIVAYEEGAEPYVTHAGFDTWRVADYNLNLLQASKNIPVQVPRKLSAMLALGKLEQNNYTRQNIIDLAADIQKHTNKDSTKGIVLLFLDGYYIKDGISNNRILGINIDGSAVVAIFKPVVVSASTEQSDRALLEQSTITHEIGHVLGLVNNGVRATSAHHDEANGAHCTNTACVMYWKNGAGEVAQFMSSFLAGSDVKMFGDQCIADIAAK